MGLEWPERGSDVGRWMVLRVVEGCEGGFVGGRGGVSNCWAVGRIVVELSEARELGVA